VSQSILFASIAALGLMIAFYYALTGFACPIFYRHELRKSFKNLVFIGIAPTIGALMLVAAFIKSSSDLYSSSDNGQLFGIGEAFVIGYGFLIAGVVLMFVWQLINPEFFRKRPETFDPNATPRVEALDPSTAGA
jgi:hypothetical protein